MNPLPVFYQDRSAIVAPLMTGHRRSRDFIRKLANQKETMADIDSLLLIVAPQPYVYGLCRMFQTLREGKPPLVVIVHALGEALVAMGIEPPQFEPSVVQHSC